MNKKFLYSFMIFALLCGMVGLATWAPQTTVKADPPATEECSGSDSSGDVNGRPCDPGGTHDPNPNGCEHGEPECEPSPTVTEPSPTVTEPSPTVTEPSPTPVVTSTPTPEEEEEKVKEKPAPAAATPICNTCCDSHVTIDIMDMPGFDYGVEYTFTINQKPWRVIVYDMATSDLDLTDTELSNCFCGPDIAVHPEVGQTLTVVIIEANGDKHVSEVSMIRAVDN